MLPSSTHRSDSQSWCEDEPVGGGGDDMMLMSAILQSGLSRPALQLFYMRSWGISSQENIWDEKQPHVTCSCFSRLGRSCRVQVWNIIVNFTFGRLIKVVWLLWGILVKVYQHGLYIYGTWQLLVWPVPTMISASTTNTSSCHLCIASSKIIDPSCPILWIRGNSFAQGVNTARELSPTSGCIASVKIQNPKMTTSISTIVV